MTALRSHTTTAARNAAGARALWRAVGMTDSDFGKPIVASAKSYTQFVPDHDHLENVGDIVAESVRAAGGVPREFDDAIAMGHAGCSTRCRVVRSSPTPSTRSNCGVKRTPPTPLVCISNCHKITRAYPTP